MTSFEHYFDALKKALDRNDVFDVWPDFEPQYNEQEYIWSNIHGLGEVLLLNCAQCDGPSDLRHNRCKECVENRGQTAIDAYQKVTGQIKQKWETFILCRIHSE
ncbi:hypothetical protein KAS14_03120 [Candidatus Bathyarchaeota archaeon]|nr:hypothetical protein [Candidatus Bathyarchaeota archaeon]